MTNTIALTTRERDDRLGRQLNAVVAIFEQPQEETSGPLQGLPVAVKDIIDVAGHPRGNGNPHDMASAPAAADAPIVALLRAAGADIFAATSLLQYAAWATKSMCC